MEQKINTRVKCKLCNQTVFYNKLCKKCYIISSPHPNDSNTNFYEDEKDITVSITPYATTIHTCNLCKGESGSLLLVCHKIGCKYHDRYYKYVKYDQYLTKSTHFSNEKIPEEQQKVEQQFNLLYISNRTPIKTNISNRINTKPFSPSFDSDDIPFFPIGKNDKMELVD